MGIILRLLVVFERKALRAERLSVRMSNKLIFIQIAPVTP